MVTEFWCNPASFGLSSLRLQEPRKGDEGEGGGGELVAERRIRIGLNQPGHHQDETQGRDFDPAWAISAPETAGTRWSL